MNQPEIKETGIKDVSFGKNCTVYQPVNLYECIIGDDCMIGPYTEIQSGSIIGNRTRVQSHCFICSLVLIGDDCFISHGVKFTNDRFKGREWEPTFIGNRVKIGTNSTLLPVWIGSDVVIGAGSVVTQDIREPGVYAGNPARRIR